MQTDYFSGPKETLDGMRFARYINAFHGHLSVVGRPVEPLLCQRLNP
jgi:hypothetical protein